MEINGGPGRITAFRDVEGVQIVMGLPVKLNILVEAPGVINNPAMYNIYQEITKH